LFRFSRQHSFNNFSHQEIRLFTFQEKKKQLKKKEKKTPIKASKISNACNENIQTK
jgi:hypothetical protein